MAHFRNFAKLHRWVYETTDGRIGSNLLGIPMLLLTTVGRKSGIERTTPVAYYPHGEDCVVAGSNHGQEYPPAWWLNLQTHPIATVRVGRKVSRRQAILTEGEERAVCWKGLLSVYPQFQDYDAQTKREIPIILLRDIKPKT